MERDTKPPAPSQLQVLALGLPRSGTYSMASALSQLGLNKPFHGIDIGMNKKAWAIIDQACDASFPVLDSYNGRPFTRAQWDELFKDSEAVTDVGALFAPQLIEAYPEARVILVIRDFDSWLRSMEMLFDLIWNPLSTIMSYVVDPLLGITVGITVRKLLLGFFEARDVGEARRNASRIFERHHQQIRKMVPPQQLLEYRMGQGWEPICDFLGKPVPETPFPRSNDSEALAKLFWEGKKNSCYAAAKMCLPWLGVISAAAVFVYLSSIV
ncbi:hypothetical protein XA68_12645 [Ophiocordyceps unilateralis]|uniref:Sulfotransferase domain-containing protein n=1 Tax=Ophiocordyceps unilateralis TaxID=268505 RepID=A0A2A9PDC1_OPHUN|nr:hypothetical protein XA68_12645 [Ophiocordyceps unilateralis]